MNFNRGHRIWDDVLHDMDKSSDVAGAPGGGDSSKSRDALVSKKRRIRFSTAWDILLLKAVVTADAHLAPHGEAQMRFQDALTHFVAAVPPATFETIQAPSWKTLNDRFKKIVADHREAVKRNEAASGILEVRGEQEMKLDDIFQAVDGNEEARRAERDERTELDKRLRTAGEEIRNRAVSRASSSANCDASGASEGASSLIPTISTPLTRQRSINGLASDDEDEALMKRHIQQQKDAEMRRLKLEEERFEFQKVQSERESEHMRRREALEERRFDLEERRLQMDEQREIIEREERRAAISERKEMTNILSALVKKLT